MPKKQYYKEEAVPRGLIEYHAEKAVALRGRGGSLLALGPSRNVVGTQPLLFVGGASAAQSGVAVGEPLARRKLRLKTDVRRDNTREKEGGSGRYQSRGNRRNKARKHNRDVANRNNERDNTGSNTLGNGP